MVAVEPIVRPQVINLQGPLEIVQGSGNFFEFQIKDEDGNVLNIAGGTVKSEFRTASLNSGGLTTNCPQPLMYISDGANGKIFMHLPNSVTKYTAGQVKNGVFDIELTPAGGIKYRVVQGKWTIDSKQVTNDLNS